MDIYKGIFCFCFSLSSLFFPFSFVKTNEKKKSYDKRKKQGRKGKANAKFTFTFLYYFFLKRERERRWAGEWQGKGGTRSIDPFSSTLFSTLFTHTSALIARFIISCGIRNYAVATAESTLTIGGSMCVLTMYSSGINSHSILLYICVAQVNKTNYKLSEEKKKSLV